MAASMTRPLAATSSPRRTFASVSTSSAGMYSASTTTGERPGALIRMSGRRPGCLEMAWVFSERTLLRGSMAWSRMPRALLAFGSVWRGMLHLYLNEAVRVGRNTIQALWLGIAHLVGHFLL